MPTCPSCGKENVQTGGNYCSFCGSNLQKEATTQPVKSSASPMSSASQQGPETSSSYDLHRLEKATKRVERLSYIVTAEIVVLAILLIFFYFIFY